MNTPNPLLDDTTDLPRFDAIRPEHVTPALDALLAAAEAALDGAAALPADADALAARLDPPVERLRRAWGHVSHLQQVLDTPALRAAHGENLARVTDFFTRLGADAALFEKTRAIAAAPGFAALPPARRKAIADALRDFELGGAALEGAARTRFAEVQARQAELSRRFGENVLDATDEWVLDVPEARLAGVPADVVRSAREAAAAAGVDGCRLTLHAPCRIPLLATADDRDLRRTVWQAHGRLASEFGPPARDNGPLMAELLALRAEEAALLGRPDYATLSLVPKMAGSPAEVMAFLDDLARRARPFAERELAELQAHARTLGLDRLEPWDRAWVGEKLKQARFGIDDETLRPWFPLPRVLEGLLALVQRLFGVALEPAEAPVWHPDVRFYRVRRGDETLGGVYLDLYARAGKQGGAWMDDARARWRRPDGTLQLPLAHLVCNFAPPAGGRPSRLSHAEVLTLFHEFGHGLHHLLTRVEELSLSGLSGVEWDAVELPSQFMENFAWEWEVLHSLSAHAETGEPLPRALFERLTAARHFGSALQLLRYVEYGVFDLRLHREPGAAQRVRAIAREAEAAYALLPRPDDDRWPNGFLHVFDGGYAAGFYGYQWAEVLSSDAYEAFEQAGLFDPATGARFREAVLETGGTRGAAENFAAFRGRAPRIDAFLRHQGLAEAA